MKIAVVQNRRNAYRGFLTPTVTNMTEMFNSIMKAEPSVTYASWGSESSYKTLIDNDMGGCNPCKTMTRRYNVLRISQLLLFNYFRRGRYRRMRSERRVTGRMHSFAMSPEAWWTRQIGWSSSIWLTMRATTASSTRISSAS